jgi:hypothetical protein
LALTLVIGVGFRNVFTGTENGFEGTRDAFWLADHETIADLGPVAGAIIQRWEESGSPRLCLSGYRSRQRMMPSKLAAMPRANSDQSKPSASAR